jgi:hypothetical protein
MIGKPLIVMPLATAALRASVGANPLLFGPSPEMSITRRTGSTPVSSSNREPASMAPEIEVRQIRLIGARASLSANSDAPSGPVMIVHGTTTFC